MVATVVSIGGEVFGSSRIKWLPEKGASSIDGHVVAKNRIEAEVNKALGTLTERNFSQEELSKIRPTRADREIRYRSPVAVSERRSKYPYRFSHKELINGLHVQFECTNDQQAKEHNPIAAVKIMRTLENGSVVQLWVRNNAACLLSVTINDIKGSHVITFDVTDRMNPFFSATDRFPIEETTLKQLDSLFGTDGAASRIRKREIREQSDELRQVVANLRSALFTDPKQEHDNGDSDELPCVPDF